jgi:hypothetical protein
MLLTVFEVFKAVKCKLLPPGVTKGIDLNLAKVFFGSMPEHRGF